MRPWLAVFALVCAGCGGGDGSNGSAPPAPPPPTTPTNLSVLFAFPNDNAARVDPTQQHIAISHNGYADFTFSFQGNCDSNQTLTRVLTGLSVDFERLFEHHLTCQTSANADVATEIEATRGNNDTFALATAFSTGNAPTSPLTVTDSVALTTGSLSTLFETYIDSEFIADLQLPALVEDLVRATVILIAEAGWTNLVNPEPTYPTIAQQVHYASMDPTGALSTQLSGLVVLPDPAASPTPKNQIIVLSHSTGVTPSALAPDDAWFVYANLLAARGYLVLAADNWGRGTTAAEPETYLMARHTSAATLDLLRAVLTSGDYTAYYDADDVRVTLVGYSQGGHSSVATWLHLALAEPNVSVVRVYAGGGPYNLQQTVEGAMQHATRQCDGNAYCTNVDDETSLPFVTERILPGYLSYLETGLSLSDASSGGVLAQSFAEHYLANDPSMDALKALLHLSSFTNLVDTQSISNPSTEVVLFHSDYDRLVTVANATELIQLLQNDHTVRDETSACSTDNYQTIFNLTDFVGINHALCGIEMLDDVYDELK